MTRIILVLTLFYTMIAVVAAMDGAYWIAIIFGAFGIFHIYLGIKERYDNTKIY